MIATQAAAPTPVYFGWKVVGAAFLLAVFAWGVGFYGPSVFLRTLHADHGWAISTISAAISTQYLFGAALVVHLPEAHRRFGIAKVTVAGIGLAALGILVWSNAREAWQLFPAALVSGAGWAATSGAAINAIVAPWFDRERPKALSLAFNGASIGGLVFTPLWVALIGVLGFATAALLIAVAMVTILSPIAVRFLQSRPDSISATPRVAPAPAMSQATLLRDRRFVTISTAFALGFFAQIGLFAHLLTRLAPEFGSRGSAWAISLTAICAIAGRTLFGWIIGEGDRRKGASLNFLMQACGTLLLIFGGGVPLLLCGCILFGLGVGNLVSLPPLIIQREFAAGDVGRAVALAVAINQAVFSFAPVALGALRDLVGGYAVPFAVVAALQIAAALIVVVARPTAATGGGR